MTPLHPLLVFADDWGRHPSSAQHLIRQLLPTHAVTWVNTIGTRPPRLDRSTLRRVGNKLTQWSRKNPAPQPIVDQATLAPTVLAPKMWPSFRSRIARSLNAKLLISALKPVVEAMPAPPIVITTLPLVADLLGPLPVQRWVYYCVDDFSVWPGYDGETMLRMEHDLAPRCDVAIGVSEHLVHHLKQFGQNAHLLSHGVDLDHWRGTVATPIDVEPPVCLFWGVIDRRLDL
ncbi:MAG: hypothetical protein ACRCZF_04635, partial [Gemmataceae bacterium]